MSDDNPNMVGRGGNRREFKERIFTGYYKYITLRPPNPRGLSADGNRVRA
jgi:hypothetical protein